MLFKPNTTTMRKIFYIITILALIVSCKNSDNNQKKHDGNICLSCDHEEEMQRISEELDKFDSLILNLYNQININPNNIITISDKLVEKIKSEKDPDNLRWNKLGSLYSLQAETYYKLGEYKKSITSILNNAKNTQENLGGDLYFSDNLSIQLACNYVKLNDFKKAENYLNKASKGYFITDYIFANYYEVLGNKTKALKAYNDILKEDDHDHYFYYIEAQKRFNELSKPNPILLKELFYPSDRPDNEICKTDNERRTKIFDLIRNLPELKNNIFSVGVYKEPKHTNGKYWIDVTKKDNSIIYFSVDTTNLKIKYLDIKNNQEIRLEDWGKHK